MLVKHITIFYKLYIFVFQQYMMTKSIFTLSLIFFVCSTHFLMANIGGEYHQVKAQKGDGITILLQRYELHRDSRLRKAFLQLNNLHANDHLLHQHKYTLPVLIYSYDGTSIRSTIKDNDWNRALRIQKYNEVLLAKGIRSTHYTDSNILWVPISELSHPMINDTPIADKKHIQIQPKKSTSSSTIAYNHLYGKNYQLTSNEDESLKGKVYYIVSGHGGPDPGAMCTDCQKTLCEDEYAYDVSLRLARNLEQHGAIVEMVIQDKNDGIREDTYLHCDKDERLATGEKLPLNQMERLVQRTNYINRRHAFYSRQGYTDQVVVSIHIDANTQSHRQDVFFCHYHNSEKSRLLAHQIRETFAEKYKKYQNNRDYRGYLHERGLYVLRNTNPPAVLIELANINNPHNHKRILDPSNRQALANWLYEGLTKNVRSPHSDQIIASS